MGSVPNFLSCLAQNDAIVSMLDEQLSNCLVSLPFCEYFVLIVICKSFIIYLFT